MIDRWPMVTDARGIRWRRARHDTTPPRREAHGMRVAARVQVADLGEERGGIGPLSGRDRSVQHAEPEGVESRLIIGDGRRLPGQFEGPPLQKPGIHQEQGLGRHSGHGALAGELAGLREVENVAHLGRARLRTGADDRQVDRAHELLFRPKPGQAEAGWIDVPFSQAAGVLGIFQGQTGPSATVA